MLLYVVVVPVVDVDAVHVSGVDVVVCKSDTNATVNVSVICVDVIEFVCVNVVIDVVGDA